MNDAKHILIIDDDSDLVEVLSDRLEGEGFKVSSALNGEDGLKKALDEKPDMILLDIMMPVKDGVQTLKELREDPWGENARVMFLTNSSDLDHISASVEASAESYIIKSEWSMEDIIKKIKEKIAESQ